VPRPASRATGSVYQGLRLRSLKVSRSPWNLLASVMVRAGRFGAAGEMLARAAMEGVRWPLNGHRTVLLGGLSRVGKSTLAETLCSRHGFRHINLDYVVNRIYAVDDPGDRARFRASFYRSLLRHLPVGHVIEGDDLVISDRWHASGVFGQEPLDVGKLGELARAGALPAFVMGAREMAAEERLAILKQDDGWVNELSEPEMHTYVDFLSTGSTLLRDGADAAGVTYLEVGGANFTTALDLLADQIERASR
jgi:hypothetical protein